MQALGFLHRHESLSWRSHSWALGKPRAGWSGNLSPDTEDRYRCSYGYRYRDRLDIMLLSWSFILPFKRMFKKIWNFAYCSKTITSPHWTPGTLFFMVLSSGPLMSVSLWAAVWLPLISVLLASKFSNCSFLITCITISFSISILVFYTHSIA